MDESAIEKIQHMAVQATQIGNINATDTPVVAMHQDFRLHDLEKYMENRARFRGIFRTHLVSEFVQYFTDYHDENTRVFVNSVEMMAEAVFNLGTYHTPGHCDHVAILKLDKTPEFQALLDLESRSPHTQRALAEWIEDWRNCITVHSDDGEEVELKRVIAAIRNMEINASRTSEYSDGDFSAQKSTLEQIEAKSRHGLPEGFLFHCVPYAELEPCDIYVRLHVVTRADGPPKLGVRIVQRPALLDDLRREFAGLLTERIGDDAKVK